MIVYGLRKMPQITARQIARSKVLVSDKLRVKAATQLSGQVMAVLLSLNILEESQTAESRFGDRIHMWADLLTVQVSEAKRHCVPKLHVV